MSDIEESIFVCSNCGEEFSDIDDLEEVDGEMLCSDCYFTCDHCSENHHIDEINTIDYNRDNCYCDDCFDEVTICCSWCSERVYQDDIHSDGYGNNICEDCFENSYFCDDCGIYLDSDSVYSSNDGYTYCENCYDSNEKPEYIHEYGYKLRPHFYGQNSIRYGIELETDEGNDKEEYSYALHRIDENENLFIQKEDGSLDNGVEIVSHPCDLQYHKSKFPWKEIIQTAKDHGFKSHDTSSCGLHIHVSRSALKEDQLIKLVYLFDKHYDSIFQITRRTRSNYEYWAKRYDLEKPDLNEISNKSNHYKCINLTHSTIELRIFKGTLKYSSLIAAIEFYDGMISLADLPIEFVMNLTWENVIYYLTNIYHSEYLKEYIISRDITIPERSSVFDHYDQIIEEINDLKNEMFSLHQEEDKNISSSKIKEILDTWVLERENLIQQYHIPEIDGINLNEMSIEFNILIDTLNYIQNDPTFDLNLWIGHMINMYKSTEYTTIETVNKAFKLWFNSDLYHTDMRSFVNYMSGVNPEDEEDIMIGLY